MEETATGSKKRRSDALDTDKLLPPPTEVPKGDDGTRGGGGGGVDRISGLPNELLCEIISLLPTKDAARTQALASRWTHLWRAAPLNLDCSGLPADDDVLAGIVAHILSAHPGPGRRFCVPAHLLHDRADAWFRSPALDNLHEIDFYGMRRLHPVMQPAPPPLPASATFRFSATLRVATIGQCHISKRLVRTICFPQLKQLALQQVRISEGSLQSMISSCPELEFLLLSNNFCYSCVRINSSSLRSIGVRRTESLYPEPRLREIIIENAPCLERLLVSADIAGLPINVSVKAAPRLETIGWLSDWCGSSRHVFGSTVFQGLHLASFVTVVHNVKILAVRSFEFNLDMVIDFMKCFPRLEKLYIKGVVSRKEHNLWRRKYRHLIQCFDIRLKIVVLANYRGTKAQFNFASFFVLNARELELMRLEVGSNIYNEEFFAEQKMKLQMEKRASRGARLEFATDICRCYSYTSTMSAICLLLTLLNVHVENNFGLVPFTNNSCLS